MSRRLLWSSMGKAAIRRRWSRRRAIICPAKVLLFPLAYIVISLFPSARNQFGKSKLLLYVPLHIGELNSQGTSEFVDCFAKFEATTERMGTPVHVDVLIVTNGLGGLTLGQQHAVSRIVSGLHAALSPLVNQARQAK